MDFLHMMILLLLFILKFRGSRCLDDVFLDTFLSSFKVSASEYKFMMQIFRFVNNTEWVNAGQGALISATKLFTAAEIVYHERKLVGYANIAAYAAENMEKLVPKFEKGASPPFHATKILIAGGIRGLALVSLEEGVYLFRKPVKFTLSPVTEFSPCTSLSWTQHEQASKDELHAMKFVILPKPMCDENLAKRRDTLCGRGDGTQQNYLGDGDMGAALLCSGKLAGIGVPQKLSNGSYQKSVALFVNIYYYRNFFNLQPERGNGGKVQVNWEVVYSSCSLFYITYYCAM